MPSCGPLRVLLVEDYAVARELFRTDLVDYGYEVEEAETVEQALAVAAAKPIDVIVLDVFLSSGSGLEVARLLRERPGRAPVFIALSGHAGAAVREMAQAVGCEAYLVKPCATERLIQTIEGLIRRPAA